MPHPLVRLCFDIEADGLLPAVTVVHCLVICDLDSGIFYRYADLPGCAPMADGLELLSLADQVIGHNIIDYDLVVLERLCGLSIAPERVIDTLLLSQVLFPERQRRHGLAAWGETLGVRKGTFSAWETLTPEMVDYCEQDVRVTSRVFNRMERQQAKMAEPSAWYGLERDIAYLMRRTHDDGVAFDVTGCQALLSTLETDAAIFAAQLQAEFPPQVLVTPFMPKRDNKTKGYIAGKLFMKSRVEAFNPGSPQQIVARLTAKYDWQPRVFTEAGQPSVKADVMARLNFPEAQTLASYKTIAKRITMLTGPKGWLQVVSPDGRFRTKYRTHGTVTGRAAHTPNIAQVPKVRLDADKQPARGPAGAYGYECRALFSAGTDWWMVGADMAGLELRCLAAALAPYDNGAYGDLVTKGDPHLLTQQVTGVASRDRAKTLVYAVLYGAGNERAGNIIEPDEDDVNVVREIGAEARAGLIDGITGFRDLFRWLDQQRLVLPGLDGRWLVARHEHTTLNTLLQGMGAVLCKRWLLLTDAALQAAGLRYGADYKLLIWCHDEQQFGARTYEIAEQIKAIAVEQAIQTGLFYNLPCPLAGEAKIGRNWAETH